MWLAALSQVLHPAHPTPRPLVSGASPSQRRDSGTQTRLSQVPRQVLLSSLGLSLQPPAQSLSTLALPPGPCPDHQCPPARLVLVTGPLSSQLHGPGTQLALPHRCGQHCGGWAPIRDPPRRPGLSTCPASPGPAGTASGLSLPAQPAQATPARSHRENACLCQCRRNQNSVWFVTQIFCLFFQNITKLKTTPSLSPHPPGRQK